ncbi:MAG: YceI family protein [Asticcacaulis sp.]
MRHNFLKSAALGLTLIAGSLATAAFAAPVTYKLDSGHTEVLFSWSHFGFSNPTAKFQSAEGTLVLDQENPAASSVEVKFDINSINSGVGAFDDHLKSADFFDAAQFPTATFKSTKVELTGADTAKVTGDLTIKGVTKPIVLDVKLNKIGENFKGETIAGFSAKGELKRSEFNAGAYAPAVSDEIKLKITVEAVKQ